MPGRRTPPSGTLSLIVRFADESEESYQVPHGTKLRSSLKDGWWVFALADGSQLAWFSEELTRVELLGPLSAEAAGD